MNEETGNKIFTLLDVMSVEIAATRADVGRIDAKVSSLDGKVSNLELKVDRIDQRLGRVETRVEGVETELRMFRLEFERRVAPLNVVVRVNRKPWQIS